MAFKPQKHIPVRIFTSDAILSPLSNVVTSVAGALSIKSGKLAAAAVLNEFDWDSWDVREWLIQDNPGE